MFEPLLAAVDLNDWVEILVVVVVVVGSVVGKIAQSLIQYFNKPHEERPGRIAGREGMNPRSIRSDRPMARPMPSATGQRTSVAPFGEGKRPLRTDATRPPPITQMPDVLNDALGEVLARLGVPEEARPRTRSSSSTSERPVHRTPAEPRQRRSVVVRTTRAPLAQPPAPKKPARPPAPSPAPPRNTQADSSPEHAEDHLGHLHSGVETRENALGHITDHVGHLQPHLLAHAGSSVSRSVVNVRALLGLQDRKSVRRAILLSELLGPPLALRDID